MWQGKNVFVTGAASGLGRELSLRLAQRGARVFAVDKSMEGLKLLSSQAKQKALSVSVFECDLSKSLEVQKLFEQAKKDFSSLDVALNCAGIEGGILPLAKTAEDFFDEVIAANLKSCFLCLKEEISWMRATQTQGSIVNVASVLGKVGSWGMSAYAASKGGVLQLTKTAALECARFGIRVNAVCPGAFRTPMLDRLYKKDPETERQLTEKHPLNRLGSVEEIANAVLWMASPEASFVTGEALDVDGGFLAQ